MASASHFNIASFLPQQAQAAPQRAAVICTHSPDRLGRIALTFAELDAESDCCARGLLELGLQPGCRTLMMVRPGLEFITLAFALFKLGVLPILLDPGMGRRNMLKCIQQCRPEALIAVPIVHALRVLTAAAAFASVKTNVTVGRRWFWGGFSLNQVFRMGRSDHFVPMARTSRDTPAAILFTSGGTGVPKGVLYTHGIFETQVQMLRETYGIQPGEIDLPAFPLFGLFSIALGATGVIPEMDPSRPARCNPAKIAGAIQRHGVTYSFGSPAIWQRVAPYCLKQNLKLPTLKRVFMAGAPVRRPILEPLVKALEPSAEIHIPYGATEALPLCTLRGADVLKETWALTRQGKGYCAGRPLPGMTVRIVDPDQAVFFEKSSEDEDGPPRQIWDEARVFPPGKIGEIVAKGPIVTREYFEMPAETLSAKIYELSPPPPPPRSPQAPPAAVWHRMGDMGYFDAQGRLWFCGRKAHCVRAKDGNIFFSVCVEALFESALEEFLDGRMKTPRTALVGPGKPGEQKPYLLLEKFDVARSPIYGAFKAWQERHEMARLVQVRNYPRPFPVDVRHNVKINRELLRQWAETQSATQNGQDMQN